MSRLERFLNLFTEVRRGEAPSALLLALNIFLILTAYYIMKPVREALILAGSGGAEIKSYASAGQVFLLFFAVPLYAWLAGRYPRRVLINRVTWFFAACIVAFYALAQAGAPIGVVFFLWIGIFNLMVPAQFWAFANDVYTPEMGKRLFVLVAFGASAGAVFGSFIAGRLIEPLGINQLLLVAGAILVISLLVTNSVEAREPARAPAAGKSGSAPEPGSLGRRGAFELLLRNRYLLLVAFLVLFVNWVNTTGEYILGRAVKESAERLLAAGATGGLDEGEFIGRFYADFFAVVNVAGLLLQLFLVSRIIKYLGLRGGILILPLIAMGGYLLVAFVPVLGILRWVKTAENATDYSLQNTVRQMLFLPSTREEKYKAKQAIDTIFWRAGDVLSALLVFVGTTALALSTAQFALVNAGLVSIWLLLALLVGHRYHRLVSAREAGAAPERQGN